MDLGIRQMVERCHPELVGSWDDYDLCWSVKDLPDGRRVAILPLLYTAAVIVGPVNDPFTAYDDRWCYHSIDAALAAAQRWDGDGEPVGWHRHPATGRRRPAGDPEQEYVAH